MPGCRYRDAAEPDLAGQSVTIQVTPEDIRQLHVDADQTWTPAFANLIKVKYKCDILDLPILGRDSTELQA